MHNEHYQHISLHSLIAPLLNELEAMKNPKWQFAVHYLVIRELHPKRLLSLNVEERISLTGRIRKIMHPCLTAVFGLLYESVFRKSRHGTIIFRSHGQNHVLLQMAGPPGKDGTLPVFPVANQ